MFLTSGSTCSALEVLVGSSLGGVRQKTKRALHYEASNLRDKLARCCFIGCRAIPATSYADGLMQGMLTVRLASAVTRTANCVRCSTGLWAVTGCRMLGSAYASTRLFLKAVKQFHQHQ